MAAPLRVLSASVMALVLAAGSCKRAGDDNASSSSGASGGVDAGSFDKAALLRSFGECALSGYREFQTAAVELEANAKRSEAEGTPAARDAARESWKKAIDVWQRMEVFTFGPAAMTGTPGGQDLRDPIYAWPLVNRCLIEQQMVDLTYTKPELATALVNTRGLGAAEYLIFYEAADNACAPTAGLNTNGSWSALGAAEINKRRAAYARAIATDTVSRAQRVVDAWDPAKGNFLAEIAGAGSAKTYTTQQMAFNAVSDALFYADLALKNSKVGLPAGLVPGCASPPCLANVESPWAKRSKNHMRNNLLGVEQLLKGCGAGAAGLGFDDLLRAVGAEAIATKLDTQLADVRKALDALTEPTFEDDLVKNPNGVKALFDALRAFSATLKAEFVTVLDLELPKPAASDND
ncbi:MAG: imelysin family protein [Deltaproteobacteria bacterium]|nr:imelysin family protein [Deltaproteobacteria bacterium]